MFCKKIFQHLISTFGIQDCVKNTKGSLKITIH